MNFTIIACNKRTPILYNNITHHNIIRPKRFHTVGMPAIMFARRISPADQRRGCVSPRALYYDAVTTTTTVRARVCASAVHLIFRTAYRIYRHLSDVGGLISRVPRVGNTISHRTHHAQTLGELLLLLYT